MMIMKFMTADSIRLKDFHNTQMIPVSRKKSTPYQQSMFATTTLQNARSELEKIRKYSKFTKTSTHVQVLFLTLALHMKADL